MEPAREPQSQRDFGAPRSIAPPDSIGPKWTGRPDEFGAIIQYLTYAAKATGPYRPQLAQFFLAEVPDEQAHAQFLANKIVALGGEPTTRPRAIPSAKGNKEMLQAILEAELSAKSDYTQRARDAEECFRNILQQDVS